MESCGICLEPIEEDKLFKLNCGHKFHHDCIDKWTQEKISCPYCREIVTFPVIKSIRQEINFIYKFKPPYRKRKTVMIEGVPVSGIYTDLLNQSPCHFGYNTYYYLGKKADCEIACPIFTLTMGGKEYFITLYLRLFLIHFNKSTNLKLVKRLAIGRKLFFDTTKPCTKLLNAQTFQHVYNFIYGILEHILNNYNIVHDPLIITALFDIFMVCLKKFRINDNNEMFQLALTCVKYIVNELLYKTKNNQFISELNIEESIIDKKKISKWEYFIYDWLIDHLTIFRGADIYS